MTNPEASPDGTGTQTDEVRAALDRLHMLAKIEQLADRESVTADILNEAASVLSAEIERLTRRVRDAEADMHNRLHDADEATASLYSGWVDRALKAEAALASAAAQYDPDKHGENHEDAEPGDQWFVLAPPILDAIRARTPDQDTAP